MAGEIFFLKLRDTRPVFEAELRVPDPAFPGTDTTKVYDLTGASSVVLHILMNDGTRLVRTMVIDANPLLGLVRYTWIATDWNAPSAPDPDGSFTSGGLFAGPSLPLGPDEQEHLMEYEVKGPGTTRLTFPNNGYDILRISPDIGQQA